MNPRGLIGPIWAMARPRRPDEERAAVCNAAGVRGSASVRAARLAARVAVAAIAAVDEDEEPIIAILHELAADPVAMLARDPDIDTAALVRSERAKRCEARGGRRLRERDWPAEDAQVVARITAVLARRYRGFLKPPE